MLLFSPRGLLRHYLFDADAIIRRLPMMPLILLFQLSRPLLLLPLSLLIHFSDIIDDYLHLLIQIYASLRWIPFSFIFH